MKHLILASIFLLVTSLGAFAQNKTVSNEEHSKKLEQVDGNLYKVTFTDAGGKVVQTGHYWKDDKLYKPHGIWALYCSETGELVTRSKFQKGTQEWVETRINGKMIMFTQKQLQIKKLENEIEQLKTKVSALKTDTD